MCRTCGGFYGCSSDIDVTNTINSHRFANLVLKANDQIKESCPPLAEEPCYDCPLRAHVVLRLQQACDACPGSGRCSGHGTCVDYTSCECQPGWGGVACDGCVHGKVMLSTPLRTQSPLYTYTLCCMLADMN